MSNGRMQYYVAISHIGMILLCFDCKTKDDEQVYKYHQDPEDIPNLPEKPEILNPSTKDDSVSSIVEVKRQSLENSSEKSDNNNQVPITKEEVMEDKNKICPRCKHFPCICKKETDNNHKELSEKTAESSLSISFEEAKKIEESPKPVVDKNNGHNLFDFFVPLFGTKPPASAQQIFNEQFKSTYSVDFDSLSEEQKKTFLSRISKPEELIKNEKLLSFIDEAKKERDTENDKAHSYTNEQYKRIIRNKKKKATYNLLVDRYREARDALENEIKEQLSTKYGLNKDDEVLRIFAFNLTSKQMVNVCPDLNDFRVRTRDSDYDPDKNFAYINKIFFENNQNEKLTPNIMADITDQDINNTRDNYIAKNEQDYLATLLRITMQSTDLSGNILDDLDQSFTDFYENLKKQIREAFPDQPEETINKNAQLYGYYICQKNKVSQLRIDLNTKYVKKYNELQPKIALSKFLGEQQKVDEDEKEVNDLKKQCIDEFKSIFKPELIDANNIRNNWKSVLKFDEDSSEVYINTLIKRKKLIEDNVVEACCGSIFGAYSIISQCFSANHLGRYDLLLLFNAFEDKLNLDEQKRKSLKKLKNEFNKLYPN